VSNFVALSLPLATGSSGGKFKYAVKLADTENNTNRTKNHDSILLSSIILYHRYNSAVLPSSPWFL